MTKPTGCRHSGRNLLQIAAKFRSAAEALRAEDIGLFSEVTSNRGFFGPYLPPQSLFVTITRMANVSDFARRFRRPSRRGSDQRGNRSRYWRFSE